MTSARTNGTARGTRRLRSAASFATSAPVQRVGQRTKRALGSAGLWSDCRGLSTMEYTVLFVLILIGGLAAWSRLGKSMATQVSSGEHTLDGTLGEFQGPGGATQGSGTVPAPAADPAPSPSTAPGPCTSCPTRPDAPSERPGPGSKKLNSI